MAEIVQSSDLPAAIVDRLDDVQLHLLLAGANAKASRVAPCLASTDTPPTTDQLAEARLILVGAIRRWVEAGSGSLTQQQTGPFGMTVDTRQRTGYNLWPSEIEQLQDICSSGGKSAGAFSFGIGGASSPHMAWCSLMLGAAYCSCGADLTDYEYPLYEGGVLSTGDDY